MISRMKVATQVILLSVVACITSCSPAQKGLKATSISSLHLLDQYIIPGTLTYNETLVGGLSGIDYNAKRNEYFLISDDKSEKNPARFYTAKIKVDGNKIDTVVFSGVTFLKMPDGNLFPGVKENPALTPDPEAIRYNRRDKVFAWSNEGERTISNSGNILSNPTVSVIKLNGLHIDTFPLTDNMHVSVLEKGPRRNGTFEGLTYDSSYNKLFVSVEEPLYDDGNRATVDSGGWTRIIEYDAKSHKQLAQYAYPLDKLSYAPVPKGAFALNGVTDILFVREKQFIVVERSFSTGRLSCTIKVYLADISAASDVSNLRLKDKSPFTPIVKKLLLNMDLLGMFIDNIEGVIFGPILPNGHRTLVFIADNNFSPLQLSQLLWFEIIP